MIYYNTVNQDYIKSGFSPHRTLKKVYAVTRYGEVFADITPDVTALSLSSQYAQGVRSTCKISVHNTGKYDISDEDNPFFTGNRFLVQSGITTGSDTWIFSEGMYVSANVSESKGTVNAELVDKFALFTNNLSNQNLNEGLTIKANSDIATAIKDILTLEDGTGHPADPIPPLIDADFYKETVPHDIELGKNANIGQVLTEIATILGADIYYSPTGQLIVTKNISDEAYRYSPSVSFSKNDVRLTGWNKSIDQSKIINSVTVIGKTTSGLTIQSTAENNNPASPNRISLIGLKSTAVETDLCSTEQRCKDYAEYTLRNYILRSETVNFTYGALIPHIREGDIIDIDNIRYIVNNFTKDVMKNSMTFSCSIIQSI